MEDLTHVGLIFQCPQLLCTHDLLAGVPGRRFLSHQNAHRSEEHNQRCPRKHAIAGICDCTTYKCLNCHCLGIPYLDRGDGRVSQQAYMSKFILEDCIIHAVEQPPWVIRVGGICDTAIARRSAMNDTECVCVVITEDTPSAAHNLLAQIAQGYTRIPR